MSMFEPVPRLQPFLSELYNDVNRKRSWDYMYGYLSRNTGYLVRKVNTETTEVQDFIRPLAWLYAIATKMDIDLELAIFSRFPDVCPYCVVAPCDCLKTQKNPSPRSSVVGKASYLVNKELAKKYIVFKNTTLNPDLDKAVEILAAIFPNNEVIWKFAGPYFHFTKLHEELAELHEAISHFESKRKTKESVVEEIADVAAWILGMWTLVLPNKSIQHEILGYFSNGCPVCLKHKCSCNDRNDRANGLIDLETLELIKTELNAIAISTPAHEIGQVEELTVSIDAAMKSGSERDAEQVLQGVGNFVQKAQSAITSAGNAADTTLGAYKKINALIDALSPLVKGFMN